MIRKSFQDSATFKRRYGLPLDVDADVHVEAAAGVDAAEVDRPAEGARRQALRIESSQSARRRPAEPAESRRGARAPRAPMPAAQPESRHQSRPPRGAASAPAGMSSLRAEPLQQWACRAPRTALTPVRAGGHQQQGGWGGLEDEALLHPGSAPHDEALVDLPWRHEEF